MKRICVALSLFAALLLVTTALAQTGVGTVKGTVLDPSRSAVSNAKATLTSQNTNISWTQRERPLKPIARGLSVKGKQETANRKRHVSFGETRPEGDCMSASVQRASGDDIGPHQAIVCS